MSSSDYQSYRRIYACLLRSHISLHQGRDREEVAEHLLSAIEACGEADQVDSGIVEGIREVALWLVLNGERSTMDFTLTNTVRMSEEAMTRSVRACPTSSPEVEDSSSPAPSVQEVTNP